MRTAAIFDNLNPQQREAVAHVDGPLLILAGPGSGKTRVVTHRIANLIDQGVSPYSILALTFTNKAAGEMRNRLHALVGDEPVWMGTFHGYCARLLRRHARLVGLPENYSIYDTDDARRALKQAVTTSGVELTHLNLDQIARKISDFKSKLVTPEVLQGEARSAQQHVLAKVYPAYQAQLLRSGAVDFDDLLLHTAVLLRNSAELRADLDARHRYILVDEYQDTNLAQYVIVRCLSIDFPNLNVTGDPDQSVYGWRGANIENILNFEKDYPHVRTVRLEQNYRSTPEILSAADMLIQHNQRRKAKSLVPTRQPGSPIRLCVYPSDHDEAEHIVGQISMAILDGGQRANEFAILYRTNAQSRLLEKALLAHRIHYQLIGGFRFYHRQEIKDLLAYLRLIHNAVDDVAFGRVINTPPRGLGDKSLLKVQELATSRSWPMLVALRTAIEYGLLSKRAAVGAKEFLQLYDELVSLSTGSIVDLLAHLLNATNYVTFLQNKKAEAADESVQENINELLADARQADEQYGDDNALEQFLEQVSLLSDADSWEASSDRVTLMTLHSAKGLEFPNVYIIAIEQDILPHARSKEFPEQVEEERRLLFVGMTRAKDQLQLSVAKRRGFGQSRMSIASPFLMELPRSEIQMTDFTQQQYDFDESDDWDDSDRRTRSRWHAGDSELEDDDTIPSEGIAMDEDTCQLPPEEIASRMVGLKRRGKSVPMGRLKTASEMFDTDAVRPIAYDCFRVGVAVTHPNYGCGTIVTTSGRGLKQTVKVEFDDGVERSFRIAQANLSLTDEA